MGGEFGKPPHHFVAPLQGRGIADL